LFLKIERGEGVEQLH